MSLFLPQIFADKRRFKKIFPRNPRKSAAKYFLLIYATWYKMQKPEHW